MNVLYSVKNKPSFDELIQSLHAMSEEEKAHFTTIFQGMVIGIEIGRNQERHMKRAQVIGLEEIE
ncbi:hypothetical protein [Metasolibacillus fluoroglycofenilyticus]|uniref:hypothetical protein n=1 Tax=Metasolibacillus fluoroglycofenilyticus TaxID=1239396 RepID=UPI000D35B7DF|nr:hypothetical protein [Metasolibacillus fluoroglycofenilyticus]